MIRSGTTLMEQIISSHCGVGAGGELPFWIERATGTVDPITGPNAQLIKKLSDEYLDLLKGISPDTSRVTDKMPTNVMLLGFLHLVFPRAKIIHCRRNPIDTCLSIYVTPFGGKVNFAHDKQNITAYYQQYLRLCAHWRNVLPPEVFIEVDYEDIVHNREPVIRDVIEFCGLKWEDRCLTHEQNDSGINTPSMWQAKQPIYKTSLERWRNYEPWLGELLQLPH